MYIYEIETMFRLNEIQDVAFFCYFIFIPLIKIKLCICATPLANVLFLTCNSSSNRHHLNEFACNLFSYTVIMLLLLVDFSVETRENKYRI